MNQQQLINQKKQELLQQAHNIILQHNHTPILICWSGSLLYFHNTLTLNKLNNSHDYDFTCITTPYQTNSKSPKPRMKQIQQNNIDIHLANIKHLTQLAPTSTLLTESLQLFQTQNTTHYYYNPNTPWSAYLTNFTLSNTQPTKLYARAQKTLQNTTPKHSTRYQIYTQRTTTTTPILTLEETQQYNTERNKQS